MKLEDIEKLKDKTHYFVRIDDNWADEMDIQGHTTMTKEELLQFYEDAHIYFENHSEFIYYVGTNEDVFHSSPESVLNTIKIGKKISEEEMKTLSKFGILNFGFLTVLSINSYDQG